MDRSVHPVEKQELTAYLESKLPVERAAAVVAHLEHCADCRALAAQLRTLSQEMVAAWRTHPAPSRGAGGFREERSPGFQVRSTREPFFRKIRWRQRQLARWIWIVAVLGGFLLALSAISIPSFHRWRGSRLLQQAHRVRGFESRLKSQAGPSPPLEPSGPMIVRTAALTLVTKEFDKTKARIQAIAQRYQGYIITLSVTAPPDGPRALRAILRVPAYRLDTVVTEIKNLGRAELESRHDEDITQRYKELAERLSSARLTEQGLIEARDQRAGKGADILSVEQEIARVRAEIGQLNAGANNLEQQVRFATLELQLNEDRKPALEVAAPEPRPPTRHPDINSL